MNGKRWAALSIAVGLFIFSVIINFATAAVFDDVGNWSEGIFAEQEKEFVETVLMEGNGTRKILVLDVNGVIQDVGEDISSFFETSGYQHRLFLRMIEQASEDETVEGVIVRVNSPGGGVVESAEIHKELVELQEKSGKPVYVSMGTMAASGGYYISAPADKIFAIPDTLTGSLGVIMQGINYSGLAEKYGVTFQTIKSGPYKDIMSPTREMTDAERDILQSMVNNSYDQFVKVISEGRGISESKVREFADGRVYDGRQALKLNLVDELGYFEDTVEAMRKDFNLANAPVVTYEQNFGLGSFFTMSVSKMFNQDIEMAGIMKLLSQPNSPRLMYLYAE